MTEIDALIAGCVGGSVAGLGIAIVMLGQIKFAYDEKLKALQLQLIAIRSELNREYLE